MLQVVTLAHTMSYYTYRLLLHIYHGMLCRAIKFCLIFFPFSQLYVARTYSYLLIFETCCWISHQHHLHSRTLILSFLFVHNLWFMMHYVVHVTFFNSLLLFVNLTYHLCNNFVTIFERACHHYVIYESSSTSTSFSTFSTTSYLHLILYLIYTSFSTSFSTSFFPYLSTSFFASIST